MLDELQAILVAKGCRVTEVSVTFYPSPDSQDIAPDPHAWSPAAAKSDAACGEQWYSDT
jgi:hypothetical protein